MKKLIFSSSILLIVLCLTSCQQKPVVYQPTFAEQQIRVIEPEFFYVVKDVVEKGNTTWGRAKVYYGSGLKWTDIVKQNKFLQEPGRVWQDKENGRWYVLIRPGEELIMDSMTVSPYFVDIIDKPVSPEIIKPETESSIPWIPLIIGAIIIGLLVALIAKNRNGNNAAAIIHVDLSHGRGIDNATNAAIVSAETERSYIFRENVAKQMLQHPDLASAHLTESSNPAERFTLSTEYRDSKESNK